MKENPFFRILTPHETPPCLITRAIISAHGRHFRFRLPGRNLFHQRRFRHTGVGGFELRFFCPHGQALEGMHITYAVQNVVKPCETVAAPYNVGFVDSSKLPKLWNYILTPYLDNSETDDQIVQELESVYDVYKVAVAVITPLRTTSLLYILRSLNEMKCDFCTIDCHFCRSTICGGGIYSPPLDDAATDELFYLRHLPRLRGPR